MALCVARREVGHEQGTWTEGQNKLMAKIDTDKLMAKIDTDGSGCISEEDFVRFFMSSLPAPIAEFMSVIEKFREVAVSCADKKQPEDPRRDAVVPPHSSPKQGARHNPVDPLDAKFEREWSKTQSDASSGATHATQGTDAVLESSPGVEGNAGTKEATVASKPHERGLPEMGKSAGTPVTVPLQSDRRLRAEVLKEVYTALDFDKGMEPSP